MAISWQTHLLLSLLGGGLGCLAILASPCWSMQFLWRAQPGHSRSFGMYVIDPAGNPTEEESYILRIPLRELKQRINDEEILARFSRGFFAGWVFGPERWIAPFVQGIIDHNVFANARASTGDSSSRPDAHDRDVSRPNAMSQQRLPPLGACLFGLYYLIDTSFCSPKYRTSIFPASAHRPRPERSFVEYAGRTQGRSLAASHRFELIRERPVANGEEEITIIYSHVRSNPRTGGRVYSRPMTAMHVCYAHLLFAEGAREALASRGSA
ncbi:hypothetical protein BDW72DRAFT_209633 [Aspergillus terricola var. indicus]